LSETKFLSITRLLGGVAGLQAIVTSPRFPASLYFTK
jgi:hypothetical protein